MKKTFRYICANQTMVKVDWDDYEWLSHLKWHTLSVGYAADGRNRLMHKVIMDAPGWEQQVDHINRDKLDNRRCNLRLCTQTQNHWNTRTRTRNKSGYKGVCRNSKGGKPWRANLYINSRQTCLGYFDTPEEAAKAYNKAALEYHGEFAFLNKVA